MHEKYENSQERTGRVWYEPIADNGVVQGLDSADPDYMELEAIGQDQNDKSYATYEFVAISPPTPGRYRLEIESLQDHPAIRGLRFELLVSHEFLRK